MTLDEIQILQIEPTSYCNSLCPHCPRFNFEEPDVVKSDGTLHSNLTLAHMDVDAVIKNLELDKLSSLKKVNLSGDKGDPCMHPDLDQLIDAFAAAPSNPVIIIGTNGSIRSAKWWSNLAEKHGKKIGVVFSIDGLEDTNHLYRVGLDYKTIIKNATAFINAGGYATWKMVVFKHNQHQVEEIKSLSEKLGFAEFRIVPAQLPRFQGHDTWPVEFQGKTHYITPHTSQYTHQSFFFKESIQPTIDRNEKRICPNLIRGWIYITHQHHIVPCCMMHFDTELKYFGRDQLLELTDGFDNQDISKLPLSVIFEKPFFKNKLLDSFQNGKLQNTCLKICKSKIENSLANLA